MCLYVSFVDDFSSVSTSMSTCREQKTRTAKAARNINKCPLNVALASFSPLAHFVSDLSWFSSLNRVELFRQIVISRLCALD